MRRWGWFEGMREISQGLAVMAIVGSTLFWAMVGEVALAAVLAKADSWNRSR